MDRNKDLISIAYSPRQIEENWKNGKMSAILTLEGTAGFGYDPELLVLTTRAFRLYGLSFLIMGYNIYASSFFTALGDGITSALISFLRTLLFQVAAVLVLPELLGIDGVWLAVTAAELASLAVSFAMFRQKDHIFHYRSE